MRDQSDGTPHDASYNCRLRRDIARDLHVGHRIPALTRAFDEAAVSQRLRAPKNAISRAMPKLNERNIERDVRLLRLRDFVSEHFTKSIPLERAAKVANLEPSYFSRYFREKTGVTYLNWLSWIRVQRAILFLKEGNCTVMTAAMKSGFSDIRACQRAFIRHTGRTASQIIQEAKTAVEINSALFFVFDPIIERLSGTTAFLSPALTQAAALIV